MTDTNRIQVIRQNIEEIEARTKTARTQGALYHPTNPPDAYYCTACCIFGKGDLVCWSCGTTEVEWQYVPRWGGGSQRVGDDR